MGDTALRVRLQEALQAMQEAAQDNARRADLIAERAAAIEQRLEQGSTMRDALLADEPPRIVELLTENLASISEAGAEFRGTEALVLHEAGLTMVEIAELFGVTRQRVSALLQQARSS